MFYIRVKYIIFTRILIFKNCFRLEIFHVFTCPINEEKVKIIFLILVKSVVERNNRIQMMAIIQTTTMYH